MLKRNDSIQIGKLKDFLSSLAMFLLAVENFSDCLIFKNQLSYIPIMVSFAVVGVNAYEDGDDWICKSALLGLSIVAVIGVLDVKVKCDLVIRGGFLAVGLFAICVSGLYFWKLCLENGEIT